MEGEEEGEIIWLKSCFTSTEIVGLLGTGAHDGHLDFHTAPELWRLTYTRRFCYTRQQCLRHRKLNQNRLNRDGTFFTFSFFFLNPGRARLIVTLLSQSYQVEWFISETPCTPHERTSMKGHLVRHGSKHKIQVHTTNRNKNKVKQKQNRTHFQSKNNEKPEKDH